MRALNLAHRFILFLESIWMAVSSLALFAIMIIVFCDVGLRYFFNSPLAWSYDLISLYLMVALFFLTLSATQGNNHHVRVDIIFRHVSPHARHIMELISNVLTTVVMAGILYQGSIKFWGNLQAGDVVAGAIPWPTWATAVFVPLGVGLLVLRLVFGIFSLTTALGARSATALGITEVTHEEGKEI